MQSQARHLIGVRTRMFGAVALVLLLAACGTRVEQGIPEPSGSAGEASSALDSASGTGILPDSDADSAAATPSTASNGAIASGGGVSPAAAGVSRSLGQAAGASRPAAASGGATSPTPANGGTAASGKAASPSAPKPGATPAPLPGAPALSNGGGPVVVGTIGSLSGPAGSVFLGVAQGVQVWAKDVNARGGVNGHPVKLNVYDDTADPSRHRAQLQQAIESDGVVVFLANTEALTGSCCVDYIESKRVPMIGSDTGSPWYYTSPMYFPQASSGDDAVYGAIASVAQQMVPKGKTKLGGITCVEAQVCKDAQRVWAASAQKLGLEFVYQTQVSIGQPDFTAECLAARNAGAEIVLMGFDSNSVRRVVSSCVRQSYRPTFATLSVAISAAYKDDPNLDGMVAAAQGFPWFQSGTPASDEYQSAMKRYGSNVPPSASPALGWLAAKVFERAAANLPEPPTSAAILEGLWTIQNDAIGDLTLPLTFRRDQPSPQKACWFSIFLKDKVWRSPDNFKLNCAQ